MPERPSIMLFVSDQWRGDWTGLIDYDNRCLAYGSGTPAMSAAVTAPRQPWR